jgi:esterase/lipase superfamily enzyme
LRSIENIRPAFERRTGGTARDRVEIGKVIFAAPDVSELVFKRKIAGLSRVAAEKITLYASGNDGALDVSKWLRGKIARAGGLSDGKPINPGTDRVEVIDITGESLPWYNVDRYLGAYHSAFAFEKPVLEDIQMLLSSPRSGTPVQRAAKLGKPDRFKEEAYGSSGQDGKFWRLVPEPAVAKANP